MKKLKGDICILANADIYFDHTLRYLHNMGVDGKFMALSRHDVLKDGTLQFNEFVASISQDSWIFLSPALPSVPLENLDFYFGWLGCDNRIAYEFKYHGYHVINPCLKIITRHVHATQKRNYTQENKVVGKYAPVSPSADV